jgi:hypothetical protein
LSVGGGIDVINIELVSVAEQSNKIGIHMTNEAETMNIRRQPFPVRLRIFGIMFLYQFTTRRY